ncbi:MAG: PA0069 family radical SAM protein [Phycisphaerae bacterium]
MRLRPVDNPPNPYASRHAEWLEPPPDARITVYEETGGSILSRNDSPDIPFTWSVNPYRGCQHACGYCYARTSHEYLGFGAGTDFDTKLVVKRNAPALLREAFSKRSWSRETVNFSGVTDCYQPIEACYELTRACLDVCVAFRNPAVVVTKAYLVVRDAGVLSALHACAGAAVWMSVTSTDAKVARLMEPQAPPPARRFAAIRRLADAGVPVGVMLAPIIPGLNDCEIPAILQQAADAGARSASGQALRLPDRVADVFIKRLRETMPARAERVLGLVRGMRGGALNCGRFGERMRGRGPHWDAIVRLMALSKRRLGLDRPLPRTRMGPGAAAATGPAPAQLAFEFGPP